MKVICHKILSETASRLGALARCFGIIDEFIDAENFEALVSVASEAIMSKDAAIAFDVGGLARMCNQQQCENLRGVLHKYDGAILLLVTEATESNNLFLRTITNNSIQAVEREQRPYHITFPVTADRICGELSSQSFPRNRSEKAIKLTIGKKSYVDVLMTINQAPSFVRVCIGNVRLFVWTTPQVFDVHRALGAEIEFELACDEYLPAIIFLRSAFGEQAWHNPGAGAGFVIDDPLLRKKYGFIDFEKLLSSARKHAYHVTLAFIPWNYWRSGKRQVRMFADHQDSFSICVHGCDHTRNEYGLHDYSGLLRKNFVATERMKSHARRTGIEAEALMVFPQEKYSIEAMKALSDSRQFLAAVCTACMPRNLTKPMLRGVDLLLPAQDSFYGLPVFKRFYWGDMSVFALALFLGKPAILVEHHKFFRDGPAGAEEFTRRLAELRPDLRWRSLSETVKRTHARRRLPDGTYEVRFFTDRFILEHQHQNPTTYRLLRRVPETSTVNRVLVRGEPVAFSRLDSFLRFEVHAHHREALAVSVEVEPILPTERYPTGIKYHTSVALRRILSELRDSFAARKPDRRQRAG